MWWWVISHVYDFLLFLMCVDFGRHAWVEFSWVQTLRNGAPHLFLLPLSKNITIAISYIHHFKIRVIAEATVAPQQKFWLATCPSLWELRTRATGDLVSIAAVVPLQAFSWGTSVHVTKPGRSAVVDGHTIRLLVDTFLYALLLRHPTDILAAVTVYVHQLLHVTLCQTYSQ